MTVAFTFRDLRNLASLLAILTVLGSGADEPARKPFTGIKRPIIADARKIVTPNGVERLEKVRIGGIEQWVSIRGADKRNPVLLLIHGGPGYVSMPMSWWFTRGWEEYFTVVQWDQRGAGKTYMLNDPATVGPTMTLERMVADTEEMTTWLRKELGKPKIFVIGHSWGSYLGLELARLHPDWLYAYIGVGQVTDGPESERRGWSFAIDAARQAGNSRLCSNSNRSPLTLRRATQRLSKISTRSAGGWISTVALWPPPE